MEQLIRKPIPETPQGKFWEVVYTRAMESNARRMFISAYEDMRLAVYGSGLAQGRRDESGLYESVTAKLASEGNVSATAYGLRILAGPTQDIAPMYPTLFHTALKNENEWLMRPLQGNLYRTVVMDIPKPLDTNLQQMLVCQAVAS